MSRSEYFKAMFQAGTVVLLSNFSWTNTLLANLQRCDAAYADVTGSWQWLSRKPQLGCRGQLCGRDPNHWYCRFNVDDKIMPNISNFARYP